MRAGVGNVFNPQRLLAVIVLPSKLRNALLAPRRKPSETVPYTSASGDTLYDVLNLKCDLPDWLSEFASSLLTKSYE